MPSQPPPMQADELHELPWYSLPAAVEHQKRKSDDAVSLVSAQTTQLVHRPSSKRKKSNNWVSYTSASVPELGSHYSGRRLNEQAAIPPRAPPISRFNGLIWDYQSQPPVSGSSVSRMFLDTQTDHGYRWPRGTSAAAEPSDQVTEIPLNIPNEKHPSFQSFEPLTSRLHNNLQDMPPEIIHRVCDYLNRQELGNFRRTTKKHATIGDEHMFRQGLLRFHLDPDHFDRLGTITKNSMICQAIKTLRLSGDEHGFGKLMLHAKYRSYPKGTQRFYSKSHLLGCIQYLSRLESVEMHVSAEQVPFMKPDTHYRLSEQMHFLLSDVQSVPCINIKCLKMEGVGWQSPCCVGARLARGELNHQVLEDAAGRLLRLELSVQPHLDDSDMIQCHSLIHYLSFTKNLQELKLTVGRKSVPRSVDLGELCRLRWSHLRSLELNYAVVLQQDLLSFFEAHSDLHELRLESMVLRGGRWTTAVDRMSQIFSKLKKIKLAGTLHDRRLIETNTFLCGESFTHWAHQAVVEKQRIPLTVYPPDPMAVALAFVRRDQHAQEQRRAAGLPCELCDSCHQLKHS